MKVRLLIILLLSFLLIGALGLTSIQDCTDARVSEKIRCYHMAALSHAYLGDSGQASAICSNIWYEIGANLDEDDDRQKTAELIHNNCFYEVAKITGEPSLCQQIQKKTGGVDFKLVGDTVTREMCITEAGKTESLKSGNFFDRNPDSICNTIFVLPFLLLAIIVKGYP